jgi:DNA-binding LytR/AlgR family response regulator
MTMMGDLEDGFELLTPDGRRDVFFLLIGAAIVLAAVHGAIQQLVAGGSLDLGAILRWRIAPVLVWVAAVPFLVRAARAVGRTANGSWPRALAGHAGVAIAWILVSSFLVRAPGAIAREEALGTFLADTVWSFIDFGPTAVLAYAALAAFALRRTDERREEPERTSPDATTSSPAEPPANRAGHIAVRNGMRIHMVDRTAVHWVEADGDHVQIHTDGKSYRTRGTLAAYERELAADGFLRIHRSALVHPRAIREIQPYYRGDHIAILRDGREVRIPRTREDVLETLLAPIE